MNKWLKKGLPISLACIFTVTSFGACSKKSETVHEQTTTPGTAYYDMLGSVKDSSDLPGWTGKQLKLKAWYSHGTGDAKRQSAEKDVVTPEVKRVTGVEIDKEESFDNGGQAIDVKMGVLSAANDWPHIAYVSTPDKFYNLIDAGKIYDLTEAMKKYCPDIVKKTPMEKLLGVKKTITYPKDNKTYFVPYQMNTALQYEIDPTIDTNRFSSLATKQSRLLNTTIFIRDDILKKLYPSAKSQDEIEALYMKNGKFTKEDIFDIPIKTKDEFVKFLYDIKALIDKEKITENGKPLQVTYAFAGQDNWNLLNGFLGSFSGIPGNNNYFSYYDKTTKKLEYSYKQDWLKDSIKLFNKMVRDGVMAQDSLLNNNAAFLQVLNGGGYAITYNGKPDEAALKKVGKSYRYRALWLDQQYQDNKYISPISPGVSGCIAIFKDKVKEEDLPQVLRYINFMESDVGENLMYWGPRSAGLFEEKDGKRVYKDKDLEDCMVYGKDNGKALFYNLMNQYVASTSGMGSAWPYYPTYAWGGSKVHPRYTYDKVRNPGDVGTYFNPATLPGLSFTDNQTLLASNTNMWTYSKMVPEVDRFWKARESFEKALTKTLAANSDAEFEQLYKTFVDVAEKNGGTDATLTELNKAFKTANEGYLDKIK